MLANTGIYATIRAGQNSATNTILTLTKSPVSDNRNRQR